MAWEKVRRAKITLYVVMDGGKYLSRWGFKSELEKARIYARIGPARGMVTRLAKQHCTRPNCQVVALPVYETYVVPR